MWVTFEFGSRRTFPSYRRPIGRAATTLPHWASITLSLVIVQRNNSDCAPESYNDAFSLPTRSTLSFKFTANPQARSISRSRMNSSVILATNTHIHPALFLPRRPHPNVRPTRLPFWQARGDIRLGDGHGYSWYLWSQGDACCWRR
jgi:hypothetical protein